MGKERNGQQVAVDTSVCVLTSITYSTLRLNCRSCEGTWRTVSEHYNLRRCTADRFTGFYFLKHKQCIGNGKWSILALPHKHPNTILTRPCKDQCSPHTILNGDMFANTMKRALLKSCLSLKKKARGTTRTREVTVARACLICNRYIRCYIV